MDRPIFIVSGGFDPIHRGHIEYLEQVRNLADACGGELWCILNNDSFLMKKKGYVAIPFESRYAILKSIKYIDYLRVSSDDDLTVCKTLHEMAVNLCNHPLFFCKGGDQTIDTIPELDICRRYNIRVLDGFGSKIESSETIIKALKRKTK